MKQFNDVKDKLPSDVYEHFAEVGFKFIQWCEKNNLTEENVLNEVVE